MLRCGALYQRVRAALPVSLAALLLISSWLAQPAAGYTRLEQLAAVKEADLLKLHAMGPKALGLLRRALNARGQSCAHADRADLSGYL